MALTRAMRPWVWISFLTNGFLTYLLFSEGNLTGFVNASMCAINLFMLREGK